MTYYKTDLNKLLEDTFKNLNVSRNVKGDDDNDNTNPKYQFETAKKILYFTSYFSMKDWMFGFGNQPFVENKCPVTNCYITNKRNMLRKYILVYI